MVRWWEGGREEGRDGGRGFMHWAIVQADAIPTSSRAEKAGKHKATMPCLMVPSPMTISVSRVVASHIWIDACNACESAPRGMGVILC